MADKKTSWDYQKDRYAQISLKFDTENSIELVLYSHLKKQSNMSKYIKDLIMNEIDPCYGCMGASFGDCEQCLGREKYGR